MQTFISLLWIIGVWTVAMPLQAKEEIRLAIGESKHLYFPGLKHVENLNKKLLRVQIFPDKDEITLTALTQGNGALTIRDHLGQRTYTVIVFAKLALDLEREIKELTAHMEGIRVRNAGHQVLISGNIVNREDYLMLQEIEKRYEKVLNLAKPRPSATVVPLKKMIQIEIKMIEMNKNRLRSLGLEFPDALRTHFSFDFQQRQSVLTTAFQASTQFDLIFHALEKKGFARILANPKLICKNGGEAKFLAGGEIPLRLAHGRALSVQWKPYGIKLHILPTADSQNHIDVKLEVEISMLDPTQAIEGIPGLLTRQVSTDINVKEGETIILSGLIHKENSEDLRQLPILSALPIIGPLFESPSFQKRESELMIFVTPTLPLSEAQAS